MITSEYTSSELMTINAARLLRDGDVVFVGVGLPNLACNLARRTHAPNLVMIYEAGVIGGDEQPKVRLPGSGGSMEIAAWAERCYIMTPHQKRRLPEKVDFRTSAGFLSGRGERQAAHLRGAGPQAGGPAPGILEPA